MNGAVGDGSQLVVVGDDDEGLSELVAQVEEELMELSLVLRVETAAGLIGKYDRGLVHEGTGNSHTLLLATRQLGGLVAGAVLKAHKL